MNNPAANGVGSCLFLPVAARFRGRFPASDHGIGGAVRAVFLAGPPFSAGGSASRGGFLRGRGRVVSRRGSARSRRVTFAAFRRLSLAPPLFLSAVPVRGGALPASARLSASAGPPRREPAFLPLFFLS